MSVTSAAEYSPDKETNTGRASMSNAPSELVAGHVPDQVLDDILDCLIFRRITALYAFLDRLAPYIAGLDLSTRNAQRFLGRYAMCVDAGYRNRELLTDLLVKFENTVSRSSWLTTHACIQLAQAVEMSLSGKFKQAAETLDLILRMRFLETEDLEAMARHLLARCWRRCGQSGLALGEADKALEYATRAGRTEMAGIVLINIAWVQGLKGKTGQTRKSLALAERNLQNSDDYDALGSIESCRGRMIYRRISNHEEACCCYTRALSFYRKRTQASSYIARTLANLAFEKRLWAQRLERDLTSEASSIRKKERAARQAKEDFTRVQELVQELGDKDAVLPSLFARREVRLFVGSFLNALNKMRAQPEFGSDRQRRELIEGLRAEAHEHLNKASPLYANPLDRRGAGMVEFIRGCVFLDQNEIDAASSCVIAALEVSHPKDAILMARVKGLQSTVFLKMAEGEGRESERDLDLQVAMESANEAVEAARTTEHDRLRWKVTILAATCYAISKDFTSARTQLRIADGILQPAANDYVHPDLMRLRSMLAGSQGAAIADLKALVETAASTVKTPLHDLRWDFDKIIVAVVWRQTGAIEATARTLGIHHRKVAKALRELGLIG